MTDRRPLVVLLLAVVWTTWLQFVQWTGLTSGLIDRGMIELLAHETPPFLSWSGGVHPPLYSVVLWLAEHGAGPTGIDAGLLLYIQGAVSNVLLVAIVGGVAARWLGPWWGAAAAWLLAFGTEALRPFEHYPISALFATLAGLAALAVARHGGRRRIGVAAVFGFVALWLHLSPWFFLGPLLVGLFWVEPERRRDLVLAAGVVFVAWMATTYPGLYRQLGEGGPGGSESGTWTVGWLNAWLYLPLGMWLLRPSGRGVEDAGIHRALAASLVIYAVATFFLQHIQLADGQPYPSSLHYFALVEPLLVLAAIAALRRAWAALPRAAAVALTLAVVGPQLWRWVDGMTWIWRSQRGIWLQAVQPWNWL